MAIMCNALLAARSPPRLSRCRTVFPDDAGTGLTPHNDAKLASDCNLSGLSPAVRRSWAAPIWPIELPLARRYLELHDEIADLDVMIAAIVNELAPNLVARFESD